MNGPTNPLLTKEGTYHRFDPAQVRDALHPHAVESNALRLERDRYLAALERAHAKVLAYPQASTHEQQRFYTDLLNLLNDALHHP